MCCWTFAFGNPAALCVKHFIFSDVKHFIFWRFLQMIMHLLVGIVSWLFAKIGITHCPPDFQKSNAPLSTRGCKFGFVENFRSCDKQLKLADFVCRTVKTFLGVEEFKLVCFVCRRCAARILETVVPAQKEYSDTSF
jgi:hypothetical protein